MAEEKLYDVFELIYRLDDFKDYIITQGLLDEILSEVMKLKKHVAKDQWQRTVTTCRKCGKSISDSVYQTHDGLCQWCKHQEGIS